MSSWRADIAGIGAIGTPWILPQCFQTLLYPCHGGCIGDPLTHLGLALLAKPHRLDSHRVKMECSGSLHPRSLPRP